nr:hypothetical protein [Tanacetum cinerariifolium]
AFISAEPIIPADRVIAAEASVLAADGIPADLEFAMMSLPSKKLLDQASVEKQDLMAKLENEKSINAKWLSTSKNLHKLVDSSMTARTKRGLWYMNLTGENDWGFGDSILSVFNYNKEDWEGKPIYNRFTKVNHYKGVPPPMN